MDFRSLYNVAFKTMLYFDYAPLWISPVGVLVTLGQVIVKRIDLLNDKGESN